MKKLDLTFVSDRVINRTRKRCSAVFWAVYSFSVLKQSNKDKEELRMVRIVTPKAELKEVMQNISCIKEKTVSFAEGKKRVVIKAKKGLDQEVTGIMVGTGIDCMIWGNLSAARVREILDTMAEKGCYNFLPEGFAVVDNPAKILELNGRPYFFEKKPDFAFGMDRGMRGDIFSPMNRFGDEDVFLDEEDEEE